ncbi:MULTISPECIES: CHAT domain-containing protein [Giesbergeria]|uniref:CHAT domain-containing protein n=1 Tax=Giesbergeria sinuosa TaxID=80883 RepID=A0ABV9Q8V4_9BURK
MRSRLCRAVAAGWLAAVAGAAQAGLDLETVKLAANGQYTQLETLLETEAAQRPLGTRDRHALCFAYSKTKRYDRLFACLDQLARQVAQGDRRTRLFGLDDATPAIGLMRAEAQLELGLYPEAAAQAKAVMDWIAQEGSDDRDFELQAMSTRIVAAVMNGERSDAEKLLPRLEKMSTAFPLFDDYIPVRVFAVARSLAALGRFAEAATLLEGDRYFKLRRFLDNLFSGATFQGLNYWMWADLPRGYLLAKCRLETGRISEAKADLDRLLAIPAASANGEIYWLMLFDRGRIAEQEGQIEEAIRYYRQAIEIIERQRATIQTEINKIGFVTDKQTVYARLVTASLRVGQQAEALEIAERAKSRALVDLLAAKKEFGPDTASELARLETADSEIRVQGATDVAQGLRTRSQWSQTTTDLRQRRPALASLVTVAPASLQAIQSRLRPNEVLLEFYGSKDSLVAFVADGKGVKAFALEAAGLEEDVRALRRAMTEQEEAVNGLARRLYQRLLAPMYQDWAGKDLLIVPHGVLHYLPFSMLHDGSNALVAKAHLRVLPSSSVLLYLTMAPHRPTKPLLVFGNPDLGDAKLDLPSADAEARHIAKGMAQSTLLLRAAATETAFKELAPHYKYVHVASHGQFNASTPLASRLLLAKSAQDDGSLTVNELYGLRFSADLMVLSACETGLGRIMSGDDLVGLTRAFLYSGAHNIVASLWEVDDETTAELMQDFYQAVAAGVSKTKALRDAQNRLRLRHPHPFYWSAFYLTGSGD